MEENSLNEKYDPRVHDIYPCAVLYMNDSCAIKSFIRMHRNFNKISPSILAFKKSPQLTSRLMRISF